MVNVLLPSIFGFSLIFCWLYTTVISPVAANPTEGDVRLVDGGENSQGRIEIYFNDTWWALCRHHFNHEAFKIVCQMLSLPEPEEEFHQSQFGPGNESILPMDFSCDGHESSLLECRHENFYDHHCGNQYTVGIACGELVMAGCDGGGDRTEISGQLYFLRGPKPNERECKWTLGDADNPAGDHVIVNMYHNDDDCGTHVRMKDHSSDHEFFSESLCGNRRSRIVEIDSTEIDVYVEQHHEDEDVPFDGAYAIVNGDMDSASQVDGWDLTYINVTKEGFAIQWPKLTSELDEPVRVYIVGITIPHDWQKAGRIVPSEKSSARIDGLSPFREYRVTVFAMDETGQLHRSSEISIVTEEDVPTSSPHHQGYTIDDSGCLHVTWNPISEHDRNGQIIGYTITYVAACFDGQDSGHEGNVTVHGPSNNVTLCDVRSGLKYRIGISGFTSKGMGPVSHTDVFASCSGERTLTEINGTIKSPNKPCRYGGEQQCTWSIKPNASTPKAIWVWFTEFRLRHHHDESQSCRSIDSVGIATVNKESGILLCKDAVEEFTVLVLNSHVDIYFSSHEEGDGFSASYQGVPNEVTVIQLPSWNISVEIAMVSAHIRWSDFPHNASIEKLFLVYTQTGEDVSVMLPVEFVDHTEYLMPSFLLPDREYTFEVFALTGDVGDDIYSSLNVTLTTQEGAPEEAPSNVRLERLLNNKILVTWDPLSDMSANGQVRRYIVSYREYKNHYQWHDDGEEGKSINVSSSENQLVLGGLDGGRKYQIAVAAYTIDFGPRSDWQTIMVGCGGSFNGYFGGFNLRQWDWDSRLDCSWTINNPGLSNPVLLVSAHDLDTRNCEGWTKIFADDGSELKDFERDDECETRFHGDVIKVPFGDSDFLTLKLHTEHEGSHLIAEFVILEEGKSIHSAQPSPSQWDITANISDDGSIFVDVAGYPNSLDATLFIILFNKTMSDQDYDEHHHDDRNKPMEYLYMVNSSKTLVKVSDLPVYTNFTATGFLVDDNSDIYQSEEKRVETGEGVPTEAPNFDDWKIDSDGCVELRWHPISEKHQNGRIIGHTISYETNCHSEEEDRHSGNVNISAPSMTVTICDLRPGVQYRVGVAGFTSKGIGHFNYRDDIFASCRGELTLTENNGTIQSPNRPCQYGGRQHCVWSINPSNPTNEIWMWFEDFSRLEVYEDSSGCRANDRIGFSTKENVTDAFICREIGEYIIIISSSHVDLSFYARGEHHRRGEGFSAFYQTVEEPHNVTLLSSWNVSVITSKISADVHWTQFPLGESIDQFWLRYTEVNSNVSVLIPVDEHDNSHHIDNLLMTSSTYVFDLLASTGELGLSRIYTSQSVTVATTEGAPEKAPQNVRVEHLQDNKILVTWDPLPDEHSNGQLRGYTFYLRLYKHEYELHDDGELGRMVNVSSSDHHVILELDGGRKYQVSVAAFTVETGPRSDWETFMVGCGGSFNEYFGEFNLTQFDWNELYCTWTINNPGLGSPVLYIAAHDVQLRSCEGWTKVFKSDDSEVFHHGGCSSVHGEVVEVAFDGSSFLTLKLRMSHEWSYVRSEFVILEGGNNLNSAAPTVWDITPNITDDGTVLLDLSGSPDDIDNSFFIISANKTRENQDDEHHDDDDDNDDGRYLFMVNSSREIVEISGVPVFSNFTAMVYIVDTAHNIFKSEEFRFQTGEGVPDEAPHIEDLEIDANDCVDIKWNSISKEHRNGLILGYRISYHTDCYSEEDPLRHSGHVDVFAPSTNYKLCGLRPGLQYRIRVAGFTSRGPGKFNDREIFTSCGGPRTLTQSNGTIHSPNKPCQYGGKQHCHWSIRPNTSTPLQAIWVKFSDFRLEEYEDSDCWSNDWLSISKGEIGTATLMCGHKGDFTVLLSSGQADITFNTRGKDHRRGDGFQAWYEGVHEVVTAIQEPSWTFSVNIDSLSPEFTWSSFPRGDHVDHFAVRFTQDNVSVMLPVGEHDSPHHRRNLLLPNRDYVFDVVAFAGDKIYSSQSSSAKTPEGAPGIAPPNVRLQSMLHNHIRVIWDPLPGKFANGELRGYFVYIREYKNHYEWSDDGELGTSINVSHSETQVVLDDLDGGRKYQISVAAFTVDVGPRSEWQTIVVGCGGTFSGFFGAFHLTQWDWDSRLDCSWTTSNAGVSSAVLLLSAHDVQLRSCGDSVRIFASDGTEVFHYEGCSESSDEVRGEIVEVPFDGSNYLTIKLHTEHEGSHVTSHFCILEAGKSLYSAQPSPTPWNIKANSLDDGGVLVNLTGDPASHDTNFYIISMNKTELNQHDYGDHHDDRNKPARYLHMANSSDILAIVSGIPVYSEFEAVVYRVDTTHDIHKSEIFSFETAEGVPSEGPGHVEYKILSQDSVYIEWSEISQEHHKGKLLGYTISYRPQCSDEGSSTQTNVGLSTRTYTITGLLPGTRYDILIAGYTAKGVGKERHMDFTTSCGGVRTLTEINGRVHGPNYPCRYRGPQYCRWTIVPSGPTKAILMSFENFRLDRDHESFCSVNDWLGISTGQFNNDTLLCGHHMERFKLIISSSQVDLAFYAREHREGDSFSASYHSLQTNVIGIYQSSWTLSVNNIESTKAEASWIEFPLNDKHVDSMFLKITEANKNISLLMPVEEWDRSRHIESLYPNREYEIQVLLFTGPDVHHDIYSSESVSFKTQEGAPSMAPLNVRVDNLDENGIIVRFQPVPSIHHGGPLQGYNVYYKKEDHHHHHHHEYRGEKITISSSETHVTIDGLESMEEYQISVSAFNDVDEGPLSEWQSIVIGCGGTFNQTFAMIRLSKSDWDERRCIWTIHDGGTDNAVLLLSVQVLEFHSCGHEYAKVYSDEEHFLSYQDCSKVRGEVFELPFGDSGIITSEILIQNMESRMTTEFVILKGGLHSAQPSPTPWNITGHSTGEKSMIVDWSGYPGSLDVGFFIISVNQTRISQYEDHDHDHDGERKPLRILQIVNSSESSFVINDLPVAMEFAAIVYLVGNDNEIYKSENVTVETEESVPSEGPHLHDWSLDLEERRVSFKISPLEKRYHGGKLLGYDITYAPQSDPNNTRTMVVDEDTRRVTLTNLTDGSTYLIFIGGYTSKGVGKIRIYAATFCGCRIEEHTALISSPNYPGTPYIAPDQHDENLRCYWNIRPQPEPSVIYVTFNDFFLGRREDWGGCSGGVKLYFPDKSEHDDDNGLELCGRIPNITLLIIDKVLDIKAWGFGYHRYDDEYREGTKFQLDYEAVSGELTSVIGQDIDSWALTQLAPTNVSATVSWPSPPGSFIGAFSVEKYLVIHGWPHENIFGTQMLTAEERQTTIEWLEPLKNYTLKVIAILNDGRRGSIGWKNFQTTEGVPAQNAHIDWIDAIDYSTISLKWHGIEERYVRGTLLGYRVHIIQAEHHHDSQPYNREITVGPDQMEITVTGLPAETSFRVWVAAFTAIGEGNQRNERWIRTKCGSPLHSSVGVIQNRGYPDRLEHGDCVWHINPKNKSVLLWFEYIDIQHSHECREFFVAVDDDSGMKPKLLCGQMDQFFVLVQAHRVPILSHAEREIHGDRQGFQIHYSTLNDSVWEAELVANWMVSISNAQSYSADATWHHYSSSQQQDLFQYAVVCTPALHEAGPTISTVNKGSNSSKVERLRPYTNYTAQVIALIKVSSGEIIFKGSQTVQFKTDEGVPSLPPENVKATTDVSVIHITWQHIPRDGVNGVLLGYKVFYRFVDGDWIDEGENEQYSEIIVGPTVLQASIVNASNGQTYRILVAGFTKAGEGAFSEAVHARPGCENSVNDKIRVVSSPGFPNNYPHETECYWVFETDEQYDVVVAIETFHFETPDGGPNCTNWVTDFLGLFNIDPLHVAAGPFCGLRSPFAVTARGSRNHRAVLYMRTNNGFAYKGFNATYFVLTGPAKISVNLGEIKSHEVQITWQVSDDAEQVQEFFVFYKPVTEKQIWNFKKTKLQEATLLPLQPSIEYVVRIVGYSANEEVYASGLVSVVTSGANSTNSSGTPTEEIILRMYPYGTDAGDTVITFKDSKCFKLPIPNGGMPFFNKRHRKLYGSRVYAVNIFLPAICPNGVIQFERDSINQGPYNFGQRPWLRYMPMIAPYWIPTHLGSFDDGTSKVFYHVYQGSDSTATLEEATADVLNVSSTKLPTGKTFKATWALVVTWQDLRHQLLNAVTKNLRNTFQVVLLTDEIFSFVMANYPHEGIQYSAPTTPKYYKYFTNYKRFPVAGWNAGEKSGQFKNHPRSGTIQIEEIDTLVGNAKIPGRWIFRLEDSDGEKSADSMCDDWLDGEPDPESFTDEPDPCPCTGVQAFFDERYQWVKPDFPFTYCFYTRFASSDGRGRKCCYYISQERFAALVIGFPGGGSIDRYHKLTPSLRANHTASDIKGFRYCCLEARSPSMCNKYYEKRPSEGCEAYEPPEWSWLWGDPHIVTLDSGNYTFNGLGEFTMVDVKDGMFQLQARTKLAKGEGTATVFSAAVAKEQQTSTVQANLKDEGGLEVLIDGEVFQNYSSLKNDSVMLSGSVAVSRPENNSFLVTFPSGISVTVTEIQGSLSIVFAAPTKYKTHTKGLLGTWNGDTLDDYLRPDGTTLPSNATAREIHFDFGLKWQVMSNTSLFTYNPGENTTTFANASFEPIFLDEPIPFASDELRQQAEEICQGDVNCLFDIASTGDTAVGASTKQTAVQLESESQELQNFPPKILVGPTEVNVTVNTLATIIVIAEDPNNDSLTFTVTGALPADYTKSSNDSSISLSWSVTTTKIDIEFIVSDGSVNTVLRPVINVCACQNQGICTSAQEENADNSDESDDSNEERFNILFCICQNGYTGDLCDADLDACEENFQPCFPGVDCNDLPPPANATGFQCDPCPTGYSGDGIQCLDVDECSEDSDGCEHTCINTPGSFVCDCNSGYFLNLDKKTCQDVDECSPVSDCMHICENTMGGYNCKCNSDFKVDETDSKKCVPANPCQQGQHGCEHVCYQSDGQDKCSCNLGYALNQDGKTCSDIDECATNQHRCSQNCKNTAGNYQCSCVDGFTLDGDGYSCNDVDECQEWTFNCTDDSQKCENTYGSYKCVCDEGLYWIDNMCKGLEKGQAPPPPPTAPPPRTSSDEEKSQSVNLDVKGLNISQWNQPLEEKFKTTLAEEATSHCVQNDCQSKGTSSRRRRAANYVTFTEDQVHLLPGYPKQISEVPLLASLAFYLQFPPGSSSAVIKKDVLVSIVKGSLTKISSSINANISSIQVLFAETTASPSPTPTPVPATIPTQKDDSKTMYYIIGACVGGAVVLIIVIIVAVWCCKRNNVSGIGKQRVDSEQSISDRGGKIEMEVVYNHGYHTESTFHH